MWTTKAFAKAPCSYNTVVFAGHFLTKLCFLRAMFVAKLWFPRHLSDMFFRYQKVKQRTSNAQFGRGPYISLDGV